GARIRRLPSRAGRCVAGPGDEVSHVQEIESRCVEIAELLEILVRISAGAVEELQIVVALDGVVGTNVLDCSEDVHVRKEIRAFPGDSKRSGTASQKREHGRRFRK